LDLARLSAEERKISVQAHKCSPPSVLPKVSMQTWQSVLREWNSEEKGAEFVVALIQRLETENPEIAKFLHRVFETFKDRVYPLKAMMVYACSVYRMLEVETQGQLPIVSADIGAPLQEQFLRDPKGFYVRAAIDIEQKNPNVMESVFLLTMWYQLAGDDKSASWVPFFGVVLYKMIESQIESDRLLESLGF
jgi:hypothetical protein